MPNAVPKWERSDSQSLKVFLTSPSGLKLVTMLRALIVDGAMAAISAPTDRQSSACGRAEGFRDLAQWVDGLAEWEAEPEADDRPSENLEWLNRTHERQDPK